MKNKIFFLFTILSLCLPYRLYSQAAMGNWKMHFAYNDISDLVQSSNKVYALTSGALFSVDKEDNTLELYSKITGLNGGVIAGIEFDKVNNQLIICYNNGNIDLMTSSGIVNIPDFYNKVINSSKVVNYIEIYDNKAYLSFSFGIIVLNLERKEIAETYYIGPNASELNVLNTTVYDNFLYALTSDANSQYAIYRGSLKSQNLINYQNWEEVELIPAGVTTIQRLLSFSGSLFILADNVLYQRENNNWKKLVDQEISAINVSGDKLFAATEEGAMVIDKDLNMTSVELGYPTYAGEYDRADNMYWLAGGTRGLISYNLRNEVISAYRPDGPAANYGWSMLFAGERLMVVPGGRMDSEFGRVGNVMIWEDGDWDNIYGVPISSQLGNKPVQDFVNIAVDPLDNTRFFVTSYGTGLYEFRNDAFYKRYDTSNSPLTSVVPENPDAYTRLDGAVFDKDGNLYFNNMQAEDGPVRILTKDGTWKSLSYPKGNLLPTLGKIFIPKQYPNQKWVLSVRYEPGIGIFDDGGTFDDLRDDQDIFVTSFDNPDKPGEKIIPMLYYDIAEDKNGVIWVGTDKGPLLFNNISKVFETGLVCSRVKIPRNDGSGQADLLLSEERVKAIAIDGTNRKWLGTEGSGVYLVSENGQETIHHFTTENSPLISDNIFSIAIHPKTGEVFFGTGEGIMSYKSDAAEGEANFDNVYVYPNPVRETFDGLITIAGLIEDTQVKITDLNGNLICETVSNGGIATWDGKGANGRKVNTGVYLALCVSPDKKHSTVAKILVIN